MLLVIECSFSLNNIRSRTLIKLVNSVQLSSLKLRKTKRQKVLYSAADCLPLLPVTVKGRNMIYGKLARWPHSQCTDYICSHLCTHWGIDNFGGNFSPPQATCTQHWLSSIRAICPNRVINQSINQSIIYCSKCIVKRTNVNVTQHNVSRTERLKSTNSCPEKN